MYVHVYMYHEDGSASSLHLSLSPSKFTILDTKSARPTTSFMGSTCNVDLSAGRAMPSGVHVISTLPPSCTATTFDSRGLMRCSPYLQQFKHGAPTWVVQQAMHMFKQASGADREPSIVFTGPFAVSTGPFAVFTGPFAGTGPPTHVRESACCSGNSSHDTLTIKVEQPSATKHWVQAMQVQAHHHAFLAERCLRMQTSVCIRQHYDRSR